MTYPQHANQLRSNIFLRNMFRPRTGGFSPDRQPVEIPNSLPQWSNGALQTPHTAKDPENLSPAGCDVAIPTQV